MKPQPNRSSSLLNGVATGVATLAIALGAHSFAAVAGPSAPLVLGQHQGQPDDNMRQREMEAFVAVGASPAKPAPAAPQGTHPPRYDKALLKETDAFLAAFDSILRRVNDPLWTRVAREHSLWGIDLYKRAEVFTGQGTHAERMSSPYRVCQEAVYFAKERWLTRLLYASSPKRDHYASIQRADETYARKRAECTKAGSNA